MSTAIENLEPIEVLVELAPSLNRFQMAGGGEGLEFTSRLGRYLNELVEDLGIAAKTSLDVTLDIDESLMTSYQVFINGQRCRLTIPTIFDDTTQAAELARSVAESVYQNRELFVTAALSARILETWFSENGKTRSASFSTGRFHEFLLELVRQNLRPGRWTKFAQVIGEEWQEKLGPESLFEGNVLASDEVAISLFLSNAQSGKSGKTQSPADDKSEELLEVLVQDRFFYELGLILPKVTVQIDGSLADDEFRIRLNDLRLPPARGLKQDQILVGCTYEQLSAIGLSGEKTINPADDAESVVVRGGGDVLNLCQAQGWATWRPAEFIVLSLSTEIKKHAGAFFTIDLVRHSLNLLSEAFPTLVDAARMRFGVVKLTRILSNLLDEQISIRNLRSILEGLLAINETTNADLGRYIFFPPGTGNLCLVAEKKSVDDLEAGDYSDCVRMFLRQYIYYKYARGNTMPYYYMSPEIVERVDRSDKQPLNDEERERLAKAFFNGLSNTPETIVAPIVLTSSDVRKKLKRLIEKEFPKVVVLAFHELAPSTVTQPIAEISWN